MDSLVSAEWLAQHLGEPDLVVVDASWHMPATGRNGREEYLAGHIPGARFLDIDALSDTANPAPHMLPAAAEFGQAMAELGIGRSDRIVVYDNSPLRTAARGWFMLRHFGAERVAILDGGLQCWKAQGRPVESGEPEARTARFDAAERAGEVLAKAKLMGGADAQIVDARSAARFEGGEADPRPGVAAGHIPGARNIPYATVYREDGRFKPASELERLFAEAGVDPQQPFIASCGSGVTANSLIFAAQLLGNRKARLYDGSWSEWGADPATPKALGPA
ncbi:3-mercaptopyruvate sulfurtransferase [Sphingomonas sp.]|uniref:3-mercaptopyruvate sulfurtransferase n=1 Tax=Sphingomonas sp. TaxID=28214 RepID=UPI0025E4281C|nr:3-mercaptopyruvate sulfurtransferase [Sphingomonas sp.]MBV9528906.1 3-mercaptopyruvate sulfurtransferase [Sphingomonas sp.]